MLRPSLLIAFVTPLIRRRDVEVVAQAGTQAGLIRGPEASALTRAPQMTVAQLRARRDSRLSRTP